MPGMAGGTGPRYAPPCPVVSTIDYRFPLADRLQARPPARPRRGPVHASSGFRERIGAVNTFARTRPPEAGTPL